VSDAPLRDVPQDQGARPQQQGGFVSTPAAAPYTGGYQDPTQGYGLPQGYSQPQQQGLTLEGIQQVMTQTLTNYDAQLQRQRAEELQAVLDQAKQNTDQVVERLAEGLRGRIDTAIDTAETAAKRLDRATVTQDATRAKPEPEEPVQGLPAPGPTGRDMELAEERDRQMAYAMRNVNPRALYPIDPVVEAKQEAKAMSFTKKEPFAIAGALITLGAIALQWSGVTITQEDIDSLTVGVNATITAVTLVIGAAATIYGRSRVNSPATEHVIQAENAEKVVTTLKLKGVDVPENLENEAIRKVVR
jgi:hypothetical protein